jgi:hypothetical protein
MSLVMKILFLVIIIILVDDNSLPSELVKSLML